MNYLQKNQRYTLLKFKNSEVNSLTDLKNKILTKEHLEPLNAKNIEDIPLEEKNFLSKWARTTTEDEIEFQANQSKMNYLKSTAICEFTTRQIRNADTNELLPKEERLNTSSIDVVFIQNDINFYIIIFSNDFYDLRRIKKLIGEENIDSITSEHQINSELFDWLFYKFIKEENKLDDNIDLDNINGFTGNVIDEENQFEGKSIQTAELIITKAFLSNGHPITSIRLDLQMPDATISFYLNELFDNKELKIVVAKNSSVTLLLNNEDSAVIIPIYVYMYLIPEIVKLYKQSEAVFLSDSKKEYLSEIGIEVIKTIMAKNDIKIEDLN